MTATDLSGIRFGFLVAEQRDGRIGRGAAWRCICDCGQVIRAHAGRLVAGRKKACGIAGHRAGGERPHAYRFRDMPEHRVWHGMRERCRDPNHSNWANYGGLGIKVCTRWDVSFEAFLSDMGPQPSSKHSIDRFPNPRGNYEPGNCRWATADQQARNKRTSVYVEHGGRRVLLVDVAAKAGLGYSLLAGRLKMGWPLERALSAPVRPRRKNGTAK